MKFLAITIGALFPLLLGGAIVSIVRKKARLSPLGGLLLAAIGAALAVGCHHAEALLWGWTGLNISLKSNGEKSSLAAMLLFAAPLEEGAKVLAVWPLYRLGRIEHRADGLLAACSAAAGFGAAESVLYAATSSSEMLLARTLLGGFGHVFFAAVWGYVLGYRSKLHLLGLAWFLSMTFHALFDHIVVGRGVGTLVVTLPMVIAMLGVGILIVRDVFHEDRPIVVERQPQAPTLRDLQRALRRRDQPLMLHWIVIGAFVTTGVVMVCIAAGVYAGHQLGVDFAAANESDMRSNGPLVLLGASVMAGFPIAGYLVAQASGSRSVLEPAMGAATAIAAVVALLSMTAPIAVVFALAVAPVAFGLACAGAWFGLAR